MHLLQTYLWVNLLKRWQIATLQWVKVSMNVKIWLLSKRIIYLCSSDKICYDVHIYEEITYMYNVETVNVDRRYFVFTTLYWISYYIASQGKHHKGSTFIRKYNIAFRIITKYQFPCIWKLPFYILISQVLMQLVGHGDGTEVYGVFSFSSFLRWPWAVCFFSDRTYL